MLQHLVQTAVGHSILTHGLCLGILVYSVCHRLQCDAVNAHWLASSILACVQGSVEISHPAAVACTVCMHGFC